MAENSVAAIFGPNSPKTSGRFVCIFGPINANSRSSLSILGLVSAMCKKLQIPHFTAVWQPIDQNYFNATDSYTRNLFPNPKKYSAALLEIMKTFRWKNFVVIYDADENLAKLADTFSMYSTIENRGRQKMRFYKLPTGTNDYKPLLKDVKRSAISQIFLDCSLENTYEVLLQSDAIGLLNDYMVNLHTFP